MYKIYSLPKFSWTTLEPVFRLSSLLNDPHLKFWSVHITGTNGKGTVTTKIAEALWLEGFVTGLYTSPHIERFTEWIKVNGEEISEENFIRIAEDVLDK